MTLGNTFTPTDAIGETRTDSGETLYAFKPSRPFGSFTEYYVMLTPKSNRIVEIWAAGSFESSGACGRELDTIGRILHKKYPGLTEVNAIIMGDSLVLEQDSKTVALVCPVSFGEKIQLLMKYIDMTLRELAKDEAAEIRLETDDGAESL